MAIRENHQALLKEFKKQIQFLRKKEEKIGFELRSALKKIRLMAKDYEKTLTSKVKAMQSKLDIRPVKGYAKAAAEIERQLLQGIERKARAVAAAAAQIEKQAAAKIISGFTKKAKRARKRKVY